MKNPSTEQASFVFTRNHVPLVATATLSLKHNDSTTIIVELDAAYYSSSDTGTISYRSGTIESVDKGILQPFAPMDVYNWTSSSLVVAEDKSLIPLVSKLDQNYPHPFNPETSMNYELSLYCHVELKIYDLLGRDVATLVDREQNAGRYAVKFNRSNLSSGIYFYRMKAGNFHRTQRMILMK
ncbi:MAG: T9SS type A sorting domain-containing protein [Ignavibacteriales bacterium]|nr:T9SS type A sorting domain-containing protein [Ignavibacteriales bacterium]